MTKSECVVSIFSQTGHISIREANTKRIQNYVIIIIIIIY